MLLRDISEYIYRQSTEPMPDLIQHHTKRAVIDWFAALFAGAQEAPASLLRKAFSEELGVGRALIYSDGGVAPMRLAALINGTASHTVEVDDIFRDAIYHPGCPVIAAALAVAQATGADGSQFLLAVLAGYEISTRLGAAVAPAHYQYWHPTGTIGSFGAAAAASVLLRLDKNQIAHALATVGTFAAALQQAFRSDAMSKPLHAGRAAEAGVSAALMAREGITGALDILEGEAGFGAAMADNPDWDSQMVDLGSRYNMTQITFKNHACCGHTFSAIDATLRLCRDHGLTANDIKSIRIETYQTAQDVTGRLEASTPFEAKFCLRFGVASAVLFGRVRRAAFEPERIGLPEVRALMGRTELIVDPELTALFPKQRAARAIIQTVMGATHEYLQTHRHGDPEDPLSDEELNDKFVELVEPSASQSWAARLLAQLWSLEGATSEQLARLGHPGV